MSSRLTVDRDHAIKELQALIAIPSVTGQEQALAEHLKARLESLGADRVELRVDPVGRANVVGVFEPTTQGPSGDLILVGHMDTVAALDWTEWWQAQDAHDPRLDPFSGVVVDEAIWGRGAADVKGGIATILLALEALVGDGAERAKRVVVAFVSDEESGEPEMGLSAGLKASMDPIAEVATDPRLCIYVEPTTLAIYTTQMGFQIADITINGRTSYFGKPELGVDALQIAHRVLDALWQHNQELQSTPADPLIGKPNLLVTYVNAGGLIAVPGQCKMSLIRKVLPSESMDQAQADIVAAVRSVSLPEGASIDVAFTASRDHDAGGTPVSNDPTHEAIAAFRDVLVAIRPDKAKVEGAPYWSEAPILESRLGAPCIYWAAGDIADCHTPREHVGVQDYLDAVSILAAFVAEPWRPS